MPHYLLQHRHAPDECGAVYAAFKGGRSSLRHQRTLASCRFGGHEIWWTVEAAGPDEALKHLPAFVGERTTPKAVCEVTIP